MGSVMPLQETRRSPPTIWKGQGTTASGGVVRGLRPRESASRFAPGDGPVWTSWPSGPLALAAVTDSQM
jgi:hypothetical protein